ncbi:hypothetical protein IKG48_03195 [Candidatus Saccharibacteria bacterium]|nr:hypothetical protein [Candidatus Saccharibacteria bacterium]
MFEVWIDETNDYIEIIDEELMKLRKEAYLNATNSLVVEELDNFSKEKGRHKEKGHLKEITESIERSRLILARLYFQRKLSYIQLAIFAILAAIAFIEGSLSYAIFMLVIGIVAAALARLSATFLSRDLASKMAEAYTSYGLVEAIIVSLDFRGQESIDLDRSPVYRKYSFRDLL